MTLQIDGHEGVEQARVHDLETAGSILDIFQRYGHNEVDSARAYGAGSSETMLGELDWKNRGIVMDTKYYPTAAFSDSPSSKQLCKRSTTVFISGLATLVGTSTDSL